jgi:predicted O-linked N-acetylglucosamine transferase (SPINDLY family)
MDEPPSATDAMALFRAGRLDEALAHCDQTIALRPRDPEAHHNRAQILTALGRHEEALASHDVALAQWPAYAEVHEHRGMTLFYLRRFEDAVASYDRAIALAPGNADAHNSRAAALFRLKRLDAALESVDRAIAVDMGHAVAHRNRAGILEALKRPEEAIVSYDRALACDPSMEMVAGAALHLRMQICDWDGYDEKITELLAGIDAGRHPSPPFTLLALPATLAQQQAAGAYYFRRMAPPPALAIACRPSDKIRIGYFSADLHDHSVGRALAGIIEHHDRARFEISGYMLADRPSDEIRHRLERAFDRYVDVSGTSDADVAVLARAHGIDIAVDLTGYTTDCRPAIMAHRAAPLQVGYLGYPAPMGTNAIDYIIADDVVLPPEHERYYDERVCRLPHTYMATDARRPSPTRTFSRAELGLPDRGFVFCCFNNTYKITPDVFEVWMRLLQAVDGSVLWLSRGSGIVQQNLRRAAAPYGIAPERLVFASYMNSAADHIARHAAADLFLDTFHLNAHTTAVDSLWAGLPVVTRKGDTFVSRVCASLANAAGLPELITDSTAAYAARALELARDPAMLGDIRQRLVRNRMSCPLFDSARFTRNLESAYQQMWQRRLTNQAPAALRVTESATDAVAARRESCDHAP